ncbi:MAG: winged helix-turn-helix domain-containing protein [Candidatus Bathyarchaeia archaeon]
MKTGIFPNPIDTHGRASERRSKLDIVITVLKTIQGGMDKPTRIMYAANMSWNSTQKVFADLIRQELVYITEEPGSRRAKKRYHLTDKGMNVLDYFQGASSLLNV